jgi:U4/U6 small nuclear ribonucleoprotein PRP4
MGDSEVIARAKRKQQEVLELYERTKLRNDINIAVPTSDGDVKKKLRELGHPICLFGEDAFDRRERLKVIKATGGGKRVHVSESKKSDTSVKEDQTETFYTHGSTSLLNCRKMIAETSLVHANRRLCTEKESKNFGNEYSAYWDSTNIMATSQVGDTRPLTSIAFCPFTSAIAVAGWSGEVNIFSSTKQLSTLRGHEDRCCSVAWTHSENSAVHVVSGGVDKTVKLWNMQSCCPMASIEGHEMRVNRVAVHPHHNQFAASTSDDETWRLWDIEKKEELLLQEGHIAPVFAVSFHPDGSLIATSDTAGVVRVWDMRSGRSILGFEKDHVEQVVGLDFSQNGFLLASCSGDNSVRIWDLRQKKNVDILTAHEKLVSSVKFGGPRGDVLMTAGYDCVARIWRTSDWRVIKNLPLHETRIMAADMSADGKSVATACYDRTFKVWSSSHNGLKMEIA